MQDFQKLLLLSSGLRAYVVRTGIIKQTKAYIAEKYGISSNTIKHFEESNQIKSKDTAERLYDAYVEEGIKIPRRWFLEGKGSYNISDEIIRRVFYDFMDVESHAYVDSLLFLSRYDNAQILTLEDDYNAPYFKSGDYVGFIWRKLANIAKLERIFCAVKYKNEVSFGLCTKLSKCKIRIENKYMTQSLYVDNIAPVIYHRLTQNYSYVTPSGVGDLIEI